ncbi:MAG: trigger factor [Lentisphaeria bacterium]|nr:trigger factor [Lentisphaeria bacterium]
MASEADNIKIEFKDEKKCSRKAEITIPAAAVAEAFAKAYKQAAKEVQIAGFRKGKAPLSMVKSRYGAYVKDDVLRTFQQQAYGKVMQEGELDIIGAGAPEGMETLAEDKDFVFSFPVELAPEFTLPEYKGVEVKLADAKDPEKAFQEHKEYMKGLYAEYVPIEDAAKEGDTLKVSYEADFALPEEASPALKRMVKAEDSWLWLSEPEQIPGSMKALVGAVKGNDYSFEADFPADFRVSELAGKKLAYKVKVLEGQRRVPVESDEKLAEKLNMRSVEEMNAKLRETAERELADAEKTAVKNQAVDLLISKTADFELPEGILAQYTKRELSRIAETLVKKEADVEAFKKDQEKHMEEAKKNASAYLKKFFILRKIAKNEKIEVTAEDMNNRIQAISAYLRKTPAEVTELLIRNGGYEEIESDMLAEKAADFIGSNAKKA